MHIPFDIRKQETFASLIKRPGGVMKKSLLLVCLLTGISLSAQISLEDIKKEAETTIKNNVAEKYPQSLYEKVKKEAEEKFKPTQNGDKIKFRYEYGKGSFEEREGIFNGYQNDCILIDNKPYLKSKVTAPVVTEGECRGKRSSYIDTQYNKPKNDYQSKIRADIELATYSKNGYYFDDYQKKWTCQGKIDKEFFKSVEPVMKTYADCLTNYNFQTNKFKNDSYLKSANEASNMLMSSSLKLEKSESKEFTRDAVLFKVLALSMKYYCNSSDYLKLKTELLNNLDSLKKQNDLSPSWSSVRSEILFLTHLELTEINRKTACLSELNKNMSKMKELNDKINSDNESLKNYPLPDFEVLICEAVYGSSNERNNFEKDIERVMSSRKEGISIIAPNYYKLKIKNSDGEIEWVKMSVSNYNQIKERLNKRGEILAEMESLFKETNTIKPKIDSLNAKHSDTEKEANTNIAKYEERIKDLSTVKSDIDENFQILIKYFEMDNSKQAISVNETPGEATNTKESAQIVCEADLKQIGLGLRMYSIEHNEAFPDKNGAEGLEIVRAGGYLENTKTYTCPSTKTVPAKQGANAKQGEKLTESNVDYVYLGGYTEASDVDAIFVWDKDGNHDNKFVNFLRVDGTIECLKGEAGIKKRAELTKMLETRPKNIVAVENPSKGSTSKESYNSNDADGSGYQNIPWGSALEKVKEKYPDLKEGKDTELGNTYFIVTEKKGIFFSFKDKKLLSVWEKYLGSEDEIASEGKKFFELCKNTYKVKWDTWFFPKNTKTAWVWSLAKGVVISESGLDENKKYFVVASYFSKDLMNITDVDKFMNGYGYTNKMKE
jgi:hypothetical protein